MSATPESPVPIPDAPIPAPPILGTPILGAPLRPLRPVQLLAPGETPAARVLNGEGAAPAVLVCEHASRAIPAALDGLGLSAEAAASHAAWDIGALELAIQLMGELDAPLVVSCVSRLVYDCNRPPEAPDAVPARSERYDIPGNAGLDPAARQARVDQVYAPFRDLLTAVLDRKSAAPGRAPVLITVHSFTPVYNGARRDVELGILHDSDDRLARRLLEEARARTDLNCALNAPYSARDGVTHTLRSHALPRGIANVMLEIRNDLLGDAAGVAAIAAALAPILRDLVAEFAPPREAGPA